MGLSRAEERLADDALLAMSKLRDSLAFRDADARLVQIASNTLELWARNAAQPHDPVEIEG